MAKLMVLSLFLMYIFTFVGASCPNSTSFELIVSEDKKAFSRRQFHIFYEKSLKSVAETIECLVSKNVKKVDLEAIDETQTLKKICESKNYSSKLENLLQKTDYMVTITKQKKYIEPSSCEAISQLNMMKTPKNEWAVHIRGQVTNMVLPMDSKHGNFTQESLHFALNALFFATSYGFGEASFKSLSDGKFKEKLVSFTALIYLLVVVIAVIALCILFVVFLMKRRRNIEKRECEKSNLLRNPANNCSDDSPVTVALDENKP